MLVHSLIPNPGDRHIRPLNDSPVRTGGYVVYWMQSSQRADWNPALDYAIRRANEMKTPVVVCFGLAPRYPSATAGHYRFMMEGLREAGTDLGARGIDLIVNTGFPPDVVERLGADACMVVVDGGYTRTQRMWRQQASQRLACLLVEVESNLIVPIGAAYDRQAYSAAVLRPRIHALLPHFLVAPPACAEAIHESRGIAGSGLNLQDTDAILTRLDLAPGPDRRLIEEGGPTRARYRLDAFVNGGLGRYREVRSDPTRDGTSRLSAFLHFGQISPLEVALKVKDAGGPSADAFLEELIVRRELAHNYVWFNPQYDAYEGIPPWARRSLERHRADPRPHLYDEAALEEGRTHDPYWNAAQWEMRLTGRMHGYMRMYWGKKIIEWSASPEQAYAAAVTLNDRYELDGRDPNGYAGVAWCFGAHDRPWKERPVFGAVRYMNAAGLRRKFDADAYVSRIDALREGLPPQGPSGKGRG